MDERPTDGRINNGESGGSVVRKDETKRIPPPPLHHFQQQHQQQHEQQMLRQHQHQQQLHQQQQQQQQLQQQQQQLQQQQQQQLQQHKYQHYRYRQLKQQQYPVVVAAPSTGNANPAPSFPSKLQQSLSSASSSSASAHPIVAAALYTETDRSDSGLGSSRTLNSGDERSGSHSSAFSGSDDHAAATSPLNDQQQPPPFNSLPVWRDPNIIQSMDGPIRHVDSVQHQTLFVSNNTQMPQVLSFHPQSVLSPSPIQPAIDATGILWKQSGVVNSNPATNYYHRSNEQLRLNSGNAEKDYTEVKKMISPLYVKSGPISGGKRSAGGQPNENYPSEYGQVESERIVNRQQISNREHNEKQQAEAAVHHHFEESFKLAQQQRRTNWISNLPTLPKNVYPSQGHNIEDASQHRPSSLSTTNNRGEEWKEKKNLSYDPVRLTQIEQLSTRPSLSFQDNYKAHTVPTVNYNRENISVNANEGDNYNSMISYTPYMNSSQGYVASASSVIVRNESSYKNPSKQAPLTGYVNNRAPTILSVPAIKLDYNIEPIEAEPMHYSRPSANTSQSKDHDVAQEIHHPGPLLNTHGRYAFYPPLTSAQKDENKPPPAHLNTVTTSVLSEFVPVAVPVDDLQTEPLDLVVTYNTRSLKSDTLKTEVPLQLLNYSNSRTIRGPQSTTSKYDINSSIKTKNLKVLEISLPDHIISTSPNALISTPTTKSTILSTALSSTNSVVISSTITEAIPCINIITNSSANTMTISTSIPSIVPVVNVTTITTSITSSIPLANHTVSPIIITKTVSSNISTDIPTITSAGIPTIISKTKPVLSVVSTTASSAVSTTNLSTHDSSPSTPPPVLMPAIYTEMNSKPHHHKLKKAWLQRHVWTEDLKEAGVNIDQNPSNSFSEIDDTPPVLECEIVKKRKKSKSASENNVTVEEMSVEMSPYESDIEQQSLTNGTKKFKKRKNSNSNILSENTTESDKDSDFVKEKKVPPIKIPKKRGRKPKVVVSIPLKKGKNDDDEEVRFFQSGPCLNVGPKIHKCRECRIFLTKKKKDLTTQDEVDNIFCRFYAFRRLFTNKNGQLMDAGFPDPFKDVTVDDLNLWMPNSKFPPSTLDIEIAKKVLIEAGRQFCYLVKEENKALHLSPFFRDKPIAWKKAANGVREMCDVCLTTIFNYHWACAKCGFGVCIDCVKARLNGTAESPNAAKMTKKDLREKDTFMWMTCNSKHNHDVERLMLTQIVAGDSMNIVFSNLHDVCKQWNIEIECGCPGHPFPSSMNDSSSDEDDEKNEVPFEKQEKIPKPESSPKSNVAESSKISPPQNANIIEPQVAGCSKSRRVSVQSNSSSKIDKLKHFVRKKSKYLKRIPREPLPPRVMTLAESRQFFPDNPHLWLCDGKLLRLLDPEDPTNSDLFREQWKRGQPVMISDVGKNLNPHLWSPSSFCRDFGNFTNDLIDCMTGMLVEGKSMKQFWDGFEDESKRITDSNGRKMLLKLKDWPVAADFSETLPERFNDLMTALPLKEYTQRDGKLNLASRLPMCFVRPDLGPKMYSAYGNAGRHSLGKQSLSTTNLHLDVSDAVNVMVFVAPTQKGDDEINSEDDPDNDWQTKEAYRAVDEAGCDMASRRRAREPKEFPGAVWHIYHAKDADSIRDLLNKVSAERGEPLEPNHDPIHDQSSYLDADLRARLYNEYGVEGYAILQCLGDAIFIPAGAPHQVRNLHNCIKVAEDFVSPENVSQCFRLMNEFRDLSSSHSNHEDKLQIKNIMYHSVKDSLSVLLHAGLENPAE